jgi:hypothetical protein
MKTRTIKSEFQNFSELLRAKISIIAMVIVLLAMSNSTYCQTKTPPPGAPSKDEILEFLSGFSVVHVLGGYVSHYDSDSKDKFSLKYDRLIVKSEKGYETYLNLSERLTQFVISPDTEFNTTKTSTNAGIAFSCEIHVFAPSSFSNYRLEKGCLWLKCNSEDADRIAKALKYLADYYITKDPFK